MIPADVTFRAEVGELIFGREGSSRYGLHVDEVDGLSVGEVQEVGVAQYNGAGQYDLDNVIREPRIITISGVAVARSMAELGFIEERMRACLITTSAVGQFSWTEYGRSLDCDVRRYRGWRFSRIGSTGAAEYTARFRAPSQLVYGESKDYGPGTSLVVVNRGTYPAWPVIEVTGSMPSGYRVVANNRSYIVTRGIAAGETHRIDMRTGLLSIGGVPQVGASSAPRKLSAPVGPTTFYITPASGSGAIRVLHRDTYL